MSDEIRAIVAIDHAFSFPMAYFERQGVTKNWPMWIPFAMVQWVPGRMSPAMLVTQKRRDLMPKLKPKPKPKRINLELFAALNDAAGPELEAATNVEEFMRVVGRIEGRAEVLGKLLQTGKATPHKNVRRPRHAR